MKLIYKTTSPTGEIRYFSNMTTLSRAINCDYSLARKACNYGHLAVGYKVEQLDEPLIRELPQKGDQMNIEGIDCTVIASYENTFSVSTPFGTRLVKLNDMVFVRSAVEHYSRFK